MRIQKVLEDANLKVTSVLSNILGSSGRALDLVDALTKVIKGWATMDS